MKQQGFTLIEVMIAVTIVGILLAIAIPNYSEHVKRSARTEAMTALLDIANKLEQYYVDNHEYTSSLTDIGIGSSSTETGLYSLEITTTNANTKFTVKATPASGIALQDSGCTSFTIADTSEKTFTGSGPCW
ncbi:type IV pilin protein [Pseudoalteromonas tunicata]|jgi:type IV pilus assembly protein PilE|uniref:Putative fimbrial protein n=1 Tax=Pseudoalteromonas tunicata D2 TaxID=87626 RepID=A4C618_9GAMM|nr:type IV pilin protein [Pseudoalteromonas tunicata]ATC95396.1 type IV pilus assembly protein PilE [Pseudoalteromonas tunicata]AXT30978.1 type IV pilin protein [Pseudoalteromonas tunicata]EAR29422.1 putative fimbrial protein precursor [Pseudoalteromonas tunicata D2]MDP4983468.1 type IV pilin protein [Pseudoalteromonas tunicata]MDP5213031.1 type IV pilin protein [Pseudoalteromonas tunicata]